jgi:hypothetical protein
LPPILPARYNMRHTGAVVAYILAAVLTGARVDELTALTWDGPLALVPQGFQKCGSSLVAVAPRTLANPVKN